MQVTLQESISRTVASWACLHCFTATMRPSGFCTHAYTLPYAPSSIAFRNSYERPESVAGAEITGEGAKRGAKTCPHVFLCAAALASPIQELSFMI